MKPSSTQRAAFDWQQVRQRLERAAAATAEGASLSPERSRQLLDARARILARVPDREARAAEVLEVVTFAVAGERYAVGAGHVREVLRLAEVTPVPGGPDFLAGIVNLRGEILAVFEPRRLFDLPPWDPAPAVRILVFGGERAEFGLLAEAVEEVRPLHIEEILPPSDALAGPGRDYLRGVTAEGLVVLDGGALLRERRLFIDLGTEGDGLPLDAGDRPL